MSVDGRNRVSMSAMGEMRMPGQTWPGAAESMGATTKPSAGEARRAWIG